jgi:DNA-binding NarL/FixJ family response regulator
MLKVKIGLVDDHAILRSGLQGFLEEESDLMVVAQAASGREAIDIVREHDLDVLVMDISMPGQSGVDALHSDSERISGRALRGESYPPRCERLP